MLSVIWHHQSIISADKFAVVKNPFHCVELALFFLMNLYIVVVDESLSRLIRRIAVPYVVRAYAISEGREAQNRLGCFCQVLAIVLPDFFLLYFFSYLLELDRSKKNVRFCLLFLLTHNGGSLLCYLRLFSSFRTYQEIYCRRVKAFE